MTGTMIAGIVSAVVGIAGLLVKLGHLWGSHSAAAITPSAPADVQADLADEIERHKANVQTIADAARQGRSVSFWRAN